MKKLFCLLSLLFSLLVQAQVPEGETGVAPIFQEGMVLQQGKPIPVWGTAPEGMVVEVDLDGDKMTATTSQGAWRVELPARKASRIPVTLTVQFKGGEKTEIKDVLVGEVWICAGQSNMAGTVGDKPVKALAPMPMLRQYGKPRNGKGERYWMKCEGEDVMHFSATAVYFGEALHQQLDVPVGLLLGAVSGTPIEEWVPRDILERDPAIKADIDAFSDRDTRLKVNELTKKIRSEGFEPDEQEQALFELKRLSNPGRLFALHLQPMQSYGVRGMIWYQGEANSKTPVNAAKYGHYLELLFKGIREKFQVPELPVYVVQLPSIGRGRKDTEALHYEVVRQGQFDTTLADAHAGLAVNIDINEGLHPRSKHIVGDRLARLALAEVYNKNTAGDYGGPLLASVEFGAGKAVCRFTHAEQGLELRDTEAPLFELAGEDGVFHPAAATLDGGKLVITGKLNGIATAVRYAFESAMPQVSLFGKSGLPASPFVYPSPYK